MKREEKNGGPMRGRLHIKTTQIPPFFCYIPIFQSFLSLYIPPSFANFSHLRKNSRESGSSFYFWVVFISRVFIHTVRKGNFTTQDWTEAVQQNEESFPRSLNNATLSNWASILSNLGYFCEVRSIIVVCGKIHDAFCRFDHWTVKSQIPLH